MWITIILAVLLCLSIGNNIYQKRKTYRLIDRLLDRVLSREMIAASDLEEGEYSALVSKIRQIQEVLGKHANSAEQEKEQVKSLVSNMSHQLKTPLANISLYAEILSKEEITPERKTVFSEKMQRQIDKLSWIVESLSKMVKLEQNIDGFEGKAIGIKQTILDAVDTISHKRKVIGILLSLSIGGCIFLCTTYMVENLKVHAELSLMSDDGLGSEYRISLKSDSLKDTIPKAAADKIQNMPETENVYATKYTMGELQLSRNEFLAEEDWSDYFKYQNQEPYFIQRYDGICNQQEDGNYRIKYNVYGYDEAMIEQLQDFILEGEIQPETIKNYSFINASPSDGADSESVSNQLLQIIRDVPKAVLQDYTSAIKTQKDYLRQQQIFFSSIAVILLIISSFHIVNSMNHTILARRREYGIIRAMGITDNGFYKMILQTGILYGLLADVFIFLLYNLVLRRVMDYYMAQVLQFLHLTSNVPNLVLVGIMVLNLVIAVAAVMIPAWKMGRENIMSEIRR
nr:histidine kinase dimerization/phospho-acceptor domain-containing protein [uncultured Schaedlerella sp.]